MTSLATLILINRQIVPINKIIGLGQCFRPLMVRSVQQPEPAIYLKIKCTRRGQIAVSGAHFCAKHLGMTPIEQGFGRCIAGHLGLCHTSLDVADTNCDAADVVPTGLRSQIGALGWPEPLPIKTAEQALLRQTNPFIQ